MMNDPPSPHPYLICEDQTDFLILLEIVEWFANNFKKLQELEQLLNMNISCVQSGKVSSIIRLGWQFFGYCVCVIAIFASHLY